MPDRSDNSPTTRLADPNRSRAVLIGASEFTWLEELPAVKENLHALRDLLIDPDVWGLRDEHCVILGQHELAGSEHGGVALDAVREAVDSGAETLLVYYAGHGLVDPRNRQRLFLAMPTSTPDKLYSCLDYADIREELKRAKNTQRIVILDCCFAGRAVAGAMGGNENTDVARTASTPGACVLMATSSTEEAQAPIGAQYTAFSGEIIKALGNGAGSNDNFEFWDARRIFEHVRSSLSRQGLPTPQLLDHNLATTIGFARNVAYRPSTKISEALETLLRSQIRAAEDFQYHLVGARPSMIDVYVRQMLRNEPQGAPRQDIEPSEAAPLASALPRRIRDVLSEDRHIIVIGGPGLGKSTLTVQLAAELAERWLELSKRSTSVGHPNLIPLRVIASVLASDHGPFDQAVVHAARAALGHAVDSTFPKRFLELAPKACEWLILVDGIDEIPDSRTREQLLRTLKSWTTDRKVRLRFLVATRPLPPSQLDILGTGAGRYQLQPFDLPRLTEFAESWFENTKASARQFLSQVRKARLSDIAQVPLLATIAAIVYEKRPEIPLPSNRYGLYEQYLSHLVSERAEDASDRCRRIQDRIAARSPHQAAAAETVFERRMELVHHLATCMVAGRNKLMAEAFTWVAGTTGVRISRGSPEWVELIEAALNSTGLFTFEGDGPAFIHSSFGEHLAAASAAEELPYPFSPSNLAWSELIAEASNPLGDQSRAVLIHYAHLADETDSLLNHLQESDRPALNLLAGRLIAEGFPADLRHLARFIRSALRLSSWDDDLLEWFTVAGRLPHYGVRKHLAEIAADGAAHPRRRIAAAVALRDSAPRLATRTLRKQLRHSDDEIQRAAASALIEFGSDHLAEVIEYFLVSGEQHGWRTASKIFRQLQDQQLDEAYAITRALTEDARSMVRTAAAKTLAVANPAWCPEIVMGLAASGTPEDWVAVEEVLSTMALGDNNYAVAALQPLLQAEQPHIRRNAAIALAKLEQEHVSQALRALLLDHDPAVRAGAGHVLVGLDAHYLGDDLLHLLLDPVSGRQVARAIADLGPVYVFRVSAILDLTLPFHRPARCMAIVHDLLTLDPRSTDWAMTILRRLSSHFNPAIRGEAIRGMLQLGGQ